MHGVWAAMKHYSRTRHGEARPQNHPRPLPMKHRVLDAVERLARSASILVVPSWRTTQVDEGHHMRRLLTHLQVDCVFDVGANVGQYAEKLRRHFGFKGRI